VTEQLPLQLVAFVIATLFAERTIMVSDVEAGVLLAHENVPKETYEPI
jgi:hypothetical protein